MPDLHTTLLFLRHGSSLLSTPRLPRSRFCVISLFSSFPSRFYFTLRPVAFSPVSIFCQFIHFHPCVFSPTFSLPPALPSTPRLAISFCAIAFSPRCCPRAGLVVRWIPKIRECSWTLDGFSNHRFVCHFRKRRRRRRSLGRKKGEFSSWNV